MQRKGKGKGEGEGEGKGREGKGREGKRNPRGYVLLWLHNGQFGESLTHFL